MDQIVDAQKLEFGTLTIAQTVAVGDADVTLTSHQRDIFNMIAKAGGQPVAKQAFIDAGHATKSSLKVHIWRIRGAFENVVSGNPVKSTSSRHGFKKSDRFDGYALNIEAFKPTQATPA